MLCSYHGAIFLRLALRSTAWHGLPSLPVHDRLQGGCKVLQACSRLSQCLDMDADVSSSPLDHHLDSQLAIPCDMARPGHMGSREGFPGAEIDRKVLLLAIRLLVPCVFLGVVHFGLGDGYGVGVKGVDFPLDDGDCERVDDVR